MLTQGSKVLITGGAGFIGSHVARALAASGYGVRVLDDLSTGKRDRLAAIDGIELLHGDVRNPAAVQRAMQGVAAVVHLAGVQPGVDCIRAQDVNLGGALHILNHARAEASGGVVKSDRIRVILCGSASVYGKQAGFVLHEELPPRPMTPEAVMALAMEQYGRVYREAFGVPVVNLRIFRVFGPDEDAERDDAGLVAKLIRAALDGKAPVLFGDGQQTRDLIYVDNVVAAVLAALTVDDPPAEPLNIASGEAVAVNFLWNMVLECCGKKRLAIDPTYIPAPPWDPKQSRPQIARACKVLGWAPAVRLREGLQKTVEHYQSLRNVDPNAWFAPKDEPTAPRKKMSFPQLNVPTRRFGSVVTPAFGTPIPGHSQVTPLPSHSQATPLPRANPASGSSVTAPLPRANSAATPLPRASSVATPLPRANSTSGNSVTAPLPRANSTSGNSVTAPLPRANSTSGNSVTAPLPRTNSTSGNSVAAPLPHTNSASANSVTAPLPRTNSASGNSVTAPLPRTSSASGNSVAAPPPRPNWASGSSVTAPPPRTNSVSAPLPRRHSVAAPSPRTNSATGSSFASALPTAGHSTASQRDGSSASTLPKRDARLREPTKTTTAKVDTPIPAPPIPQPKPKTSIVNPVFAAIAKKKDEAVLEVSDADLVADNETRIDDDLNFEWAPVPSVPGFSR